MKQFLFFVCLLLIFENIQAQYFQTGEDPASLKWRQINTENFQLIYPDYFESEAQKLANSLELVYNYGGYSLHHRPRKISVILHTQTVKSNGLVAYAPKRSEFYTTPHQSIYPQDWLEQLAIHEFRHVVQIDKIDNMLPGILKVLLGQSGTALTFGAMLPWWFIEGDAVVLETALSNYGRGRLPDFLMEHQAQVVEKGIYKYDKSYNGSIKNYVPNHYQLGYYLVGKTREEFGAAVWDSVLSRVGKKPYLLTPFNSALKKETGFNKLTLYRSIFEKLENEWQKEDKQFIPYKSKSITINKTYANYTHSHWLNDSTLISYKTSLNKIPEFVEIKSNGKEKSIFKPGTIFTKSINYRDNLMVWSEQIPNPRWSHSGKSLIRVFNILTREMNEFSPENKGLSPSISPDKSKIALVETDFSYQNYLSVYDLHSGELLKRIQTKNNNYIFSPDWINENEIVYIELTSTGKNLAKINFTSGKYERLENFDLGEITDLKVAAEKIYFIGAYTGKNSLYSFNLETKSLELIVEPRFGFANPAVNLTRGEIAISNYSANGYKLEIISLQNENPVLIHKIEKKKYELAENLARQEKGVIQFDTAKTVNYSSEKYSKIKHLLHFHSWAPAFVDTRSYEIKPGASLMSQNKLGTAETILGYQWDLTENTGKYYLGYTFKGWYPVFNFELSSGKRASEYYLINQTQNQQGEIIKQDTTIERFTWANTTVDASVKIPLNFTKGAFNRLFQPEVTYGFTNYKHNISTPENFFSGNIQSLSYRIYFHQLLKQSYQDVYPNFGIILDGFYKNSPFKGTNLGNITIAQSLFYLPGVLPNHGIKLYAGFQKKKAAEKFSFSETVKYPRGWGKISTNEMFSLSSDYKFPLFYPEWSLASLAYLKRVNVSLFADYAQLKGNLVEDAYIVGQFTKNISSFGVEVLGDTHFLRFYAPVEIGFRASYLPEYKNVYFDFLFSIDFNSL